MSLDERDTDRLCRVFYRYLCGEPSCIQMRNELAELGYVEKDLVIVLFRKVGTSINNKKLKLKKRKMYILPNTQQITFSHASNQLEN